MELVETLVKTTSNNTIDVLEAEVLLKEAAQTDFALFLMHLSRILREIGCSPVARMAAGLQLKNQLTSKDDYRREKYKQRWMALDSEIRGQIVENVVAALETDVIRPSPAVQCVAYMAAFELSINGPDTLLNTLLKKAMEDAASENSLVSVLESIQIICEDTSNNIMEEYSNNVLKVIIYNMQRQPQSEDIRLAAVKVLISSLSSIKENFDDTQQRDTIMKVVCTATQSLDPDVCVAALQCLVELVAKFYDYMGPYMVSALHQISLQAMKCDNEQIVMQGIEFWVTIAGVEYSINEENGTEDENESSPRRSSQNFALDALPDVTPLLLDKLVEKTENDEPDRWGPPNAAAGCLYWLAMCCEHELSFLVLSFVEKNIESPNWVFREAAVRTFGCIVPGLEINICKKLVEKAMPIILRLMDDPIMHVRYSASWTILNICELKPQAALNIANLSSLLETLSNSLKLEHCVVVNVIGCLEHLSVAAHNDAKTESVPATYCLSPHFNGLVQQLLEATDRPDDTQGSQRQMAYKTLVLMIRNSPLDCYQAVQHTTVVVLERLNKLEQMKSCIENPKDRDQYKDIQSLLTDTLRTVLLKIRKEDMPQISDAVMTALLILLKHESGASDAVQKDAFESVSVVAERLGSNFLKYMNAFVPYLIIVLNRHSETSHACYAAIAVCSDLCQALKQLAAPYLDAILTALFNRLVEPNDWRVKPLILLAIAEIVRSVAQIFKKYLSHTMGVVQQGLYVPSDLDSDEMIKHKNYLYESILEIFIALAHTLSSDSAQSSPCVHPLEEYLEGIIAFIKLVLLGCDMDNQVVFNIASLIGDLCDIFGVKVYPMIDCLPIRDFINTGKRGQPPRSSAMCYFAEYKLEKLKDAQRQMDLSTRGDHSD